MNTSVDKSSSVLIKEYAAEVGFDLCGIARARSLDEHRPILTKWAYAGMNGDMTYLVHNIEKRTDPRILVPGAKSIIVTGLNYYSDKKQGGNGVPVISRYAYGINYHDVIMGKLNKIRDFIKSIHPEAFVRSYVDSAPLLEKAWGREAGLGWPGKHSVLINRKIGSFFFLGVIITNIELEYDQPAEIDNCGTCSRCIDSCPSGAINKDRTIDTRKCLAYLTLESRNPIPDDLIPKMEGRAFGCDKCQEVCPWNSNSKPHKTPEFELPAEVRLMTAEEWKNLSRKDYKRLFKASAIGRRTYCRFMDNITAASASVSASVSES
jgi:epoxyqueuosine reductase